MELFKKKKPSDVYLVDFSRMLFEDNNRLRAEYTEARSEILRLQLQVNELRGILNTKEVDDSVFVSLKDSEKKSNAKALSQSMEIRAAEVLGRKMMAEVSSNRRFVDGLMKVFSEIPNEKIPCGYGEQFIHNTDTFRAKSVVFQLLDDVKTGKIVLQNGRV